MEQNIEWKEIKGFSKYQISNTGLVRNKKTQRLLKPRENHAKTLQVCLTRDGEKNLASEEQKQTYSIYYGQKIRRWFENQKYFKILRSLVPVYEQMSEKNKQKIDKKYEKLLPKIEKEELKKQKLKEKLLKQNLKEQKKQQKELQKQQKQQQKQLLKQQKELQKQQKQLQKQTRLEEQKNQEEEKEQEVQPKNVQILDLLKTYDRQYTQVNRNINNVEYVDLRLQINDQTEKDYQTIIRDNIQNIQNDMTRIQNQNNRSIKIQVQPIVVVSEQVQINGQTQIRQSRYVLKTDFIPVNDVNTQTLPTLLFLENDIQNKIQNLGASNLKFEKFLFITVRILQYNQQSVGSYIQLEDALKNKKAVMNIKNQNNECAIYSFLYFYYTVERGLTFKHFDRPQNYDYEIQNDILNIKSINKTTINHQVRIGNIQFPAKLTDLQNLAKAFDYTMSVFEYQVTTDQKVQVRVVHNDRPIPGKNHIDLLVAKQENENEINYHIMNIKNFNRLIQSTHDKNKKYHCKNCLNYFYDEQKLIDHTPSCYQKEQASNDEYPKPNTFVQFKNYKNRQLNPVVIFADFESIIEPIKRVEELNEQEFYDNITSQIKTKKLAKHKIASFYIQVNDEYNLLKNHSYEFIKEKEDDDVIAIFLRIIDSITSEVKEIYKNNNIPFIETDELKKQRDEAEQCYICEQPFTQKDYSVIDHNHFTGEVRGIAHNSCNLHFHLQKQKVPVIFHNLRGYDSHLILKEISKYMIEKDITKIDAIANNKEKFMSFSFNNAKFIDSFQFMASSLQQLGKNLSIDQKIFTMKYLKERFGEQLDQTELEQILNKGLFPYAWFDSIQKLNQEKFPRMRDFYDDLNDKPVNKIEYNQSKALYKKLGFKTFREWLQLYQALDVKILTDVWLNFRNLCMDNYKLDPSFYYTSPGLAWDAMLLKTKIKLQLISNPDMYLMFEKQSRGGISTTGNLRFAKANNQYVENYDETKGYNQLQYFDMNNLYGIAMQQKLPYQNFKFVKVDKFEKYGTDFIINYQNSNKGYVYEVDLEYPQHLHDKHNNYPLAPEQLTVQYNQLSKYNKDAIINLEKENIKISMAKVKKLIPNLQNKEKYVCNISNLKFYLEQGLVLKKIHRIIQFDQKDFMKSYIDLNTSLRQKSKNDFEKDFFKLMNNSVFGKTMENVRNRQNVKLVYSQQKMEKIRNSRYFKSFTPIDNNLALVQMYQKVVKLDKPSYVGYQILDLSKIFMYDYYYNKLLKEFSNVDLIMTDTDSLFMQIHCTKEYDVYDSMIKNNNDYDFSNVTKGNLYDKIVQHCQQNNLDLNHFLNKNKAVVGKMKSESPNSEILEAVSIKAKCYDFITKESCNKKIKGIKKSVVKNNITHDDFKNCVLNQQVKNIKQKTIRSYQHEIFTIEQEKLALQYFNDKIYLLQDGIKSLAYGNYKIG